MPNPMPQRTRVVRDPDVPEGAPGSLRLDRGDEQPKVKPLGASETARALLARFAQATDEHSSVELTRNAKGDTQIKVAVRDADPNVAAAKAVELYNGLGALFPMPPVAPEPATRSKPS